MTTDVKPTRFPSHEFIIIAGIDRDPDELAAFAHPTREAAQTYIDGNAEVYGHPSIGPIHHNGQWLEAVDLGPAIAAWTPSRPDVHYVDVRDHTLACGAQSRHDTTHPGHVTCNACRATPIYLVALGGP